MTARRDQIELHLLAMRMLILWAWLRLRLTLRVRTSRAMWRRWYNLLSRLTELIFGELRFMNYGYLVVGTTPDRMLGTDACQINLVRQAATAGGSSEPVGERVLEVGCGRGGGAAWMARCLSTMSVTAIDLSNENIAACRRQFADVPNLTFEVGDAEHIPFADRQFDRVVSVESSHCYPSFPAFLAEVHRVLRPGGTLCLVDFRLVDRLPEWEHDLRQGPLEMIDRAEITDAVVRALDADHDRKVASIAASGAPKLMHAMLRQFTGCRGSEIYRSLVERRRRYWRFVLRRPA
jgi:ubiquinone/menaquinone biosynthesis C-methylase UbiE